MKKVRIGLVGAGNIANTHLQSYLKNPNVEIAAICDIDPVMLAETADKYGIKNRYNTLDEMLASPTLTKCLQNSLNSTPQAYACGTATTQSVPSPALTPDLTFFAKSLWHITQRKQRKCTKPP